MRRIAIVTVLLITLIPPSVRSADASYVPSDVERARWTMHDMRSWKLALEAYKTDHGRYPQAASLEEAAAAIEPRYIRKAARVDAWGHPFAYEKTATGYRLVSAGADGAFDQESWAQPRKNLKYDDDAVFTEEGNFCIRCW